MPITISAEPGNVYCLRIGGVLEKGDLDRCQKRLAHDIARVGPVRLLFVLDGFEGWEPHANWSDLTFYVQHDDDIERIAIVGDDRWRSETLMFVGADLRKAPVNFYNEDALADARAWVAA